MGEGWGLNIRVSNDPNPNVKIGNIYKTLHFSFLPTNTAYF